MAAAIVAFVQPPTVPGNRRWTIVDFTPSTSYPANGEPMTASLFGLLQVDCVVPMGSARASAAVLPVYDRAHNTLALYTTSTGALVSTSSDQSSNLMTLLVIGV